MVNWNFGKPTAVNTGKFLLCAAATLSASFTVPALARDLTPEIASKVWMENGSEVSAVSINGKDLITFRSAASNDAAEAAEDLAAHLQDLVNDKDFDPDQLLPARDGDKTVIKMGGSTAITFHTISADAAKKKDGGISLDSCLKLVNGIRAEYNAKVLPTNFPDLCDKSSVAAAGSFSGPASWYGPQFHGRKTSDGHRFDMEKMTAAHKTLPFGTRLLVMNRRTGDSCVVEVNDRGPFIGDRVLDLSRGAARKLNMLGAGVAMVDCLIINQGN
jgi:rare lipoprotein A